MRLATGISALFLAVIAGIHSYLIFIAGVSVASGYGALLIMFLLLFGGALAFNRPEKAEGLFVLVIVAAIIVAAVWNWKIVIWAVLAFILFQMNRDTANDNSKDTVEVSE